MYRVKFVFFHNLLPVVIDDFDIVRITFSPFKTDAPLVIDPDAMLSFAVALQGLQPVAWRHPQVLQTEGAMQVKQFAPCHPFDITEPADVPVIEQRFSVSATERPDHMARVLRVT